MWRLACQAPQFLLPAPSPGNGIWSHSRASLPERLRRAKRRLAGERPSAQGEKDLERDWSAEEDEFPLEYSAPAKRMKLLTNVTAYAKGRLAKKLRLRQARPYAGEFMGSRGDRIA